MLSEEEIIKQVEAIIIRIRTSQEITITKNDDTAIQGLLDLYNKEKEQNRVNMNSINDLMKECNEENKRCMELAIELDKEKEKNLIFKGATIVSDLENGGIEIKMNADKLVALYLEEIKKNKLLKDLSLQDTDTLQKQGEIIEIYNKNYISKDKIREKIKELEKLTSVDAYVETTSEVIEKYNLILLKELLEE